MMHLSALRYGLALALSCGAVIAAAAQQATSPSSASGAEAAGAPALPPGIRGREEYRRDADRWWTASVPEVQLQGRDQAEERAAERVAEAGRHRRGSVGKCPITP